MPISAALPIFQSQILAALSAGPAAIQSMTAAQIAAGLASGIPSGIFPTGPTPKPLAPSGVSAAQSSLEGALNMGDSAQISAVAQQFAQAVSIAAPEAPPAGLSTLTSDIESALSMGPSAQVSTVAQLIATAIVNYYLTGGVQ